MKTFILCLSLLVSVSVFAEEKPAVSYRVNLMKSVGGDMGAIGDILKNKMSALTPNIENHAVSLNSLSKNLLSAFKENVPGGKSKPEVWKEWAKFEKAARAFEQKTGNLVEASRTGDQSKIGAAVKELGETCKGCHTDFRKKDK